MFWFIIRTINDKLRRYNIANNKIYFLPKLVLLKDVMNLVVELNCFEVVGGGESKIHYKINLR